MENYKEILVKISEEILDSSNSQEQLHSACKDLFDWYLQIHEAKDFKGLETVLDNGLALSPQDAAECILDYKRTVVFIRAIKEALEDSIKTNHGSPLQVLYSGSGPCGTLLIPILHHFSSKQIHVTFLDLHKESIEYLKKIIHSIDSQDLIKDFIVADATQHEFDEGQAYDIIINETLFEGLTKEPQVNVTKNLIRYLKTDGLFIPENITVSAGCSFHAKEPYVWFNRNEYNLNNPNNNTQTRIDFGPIFSLNKHMSTDLPQVIKSDKFKMPVDFKEYPDIVIFTDVDVYKEHTLREEDSTISNIHGVATLYNFGGAELIELHYVADNHPNWKYELF